MGRREEGEREGGKGWKEKEREGGKREREREGRREVLQTSQLSRSHHETHDFSPTLTVSR